MINDRINEIDALADSVSDTLKVTDKWQRELMRRTLELCYHMGRRDETRESLDERALKLKRVA